MQLLQGQLCLVCAAPGRGKSAFVLSYAVQANVPTLYFSADSDSFTQTSRMVSMLTGWNLETRSKQAVRDKNLGEAEELLDQLPIRFVYDANPSLDVIEANLQAYLQYYGCFPQLIVVDNITNVQLYSGDDDPFSGLEGLMDYLHKLARDTGACVIGLHHVTGEYNNGDKPIPLGGIKGQIGRVPELVVTLYRSVSDGFEADTLYVCVVKNRGGRSDPTGMDAAELEFYGSTMSIKDF